MLQQIAVKNLFNIDKKVIRLTENTLWKGEKGDKCKGTRYRILPEKAQHSLGVVFHTHKEKALFSQGEETIYIRRKHYPLEDFQPA